MKVRITVGDVTVEAVLDGSETAKAVYGILPVESGYSTWGDEIYFHIPLHLDYENQREVVEVGDLGYWPEGDCFCIFYGRTPASRGGEVRPASAVNVFGGIDPVEAVKLRNAEADKIIVEKVD